MYFEGAGDLLGFPEGWFGGYRQRSEIRAFPILSEVFEREILPVELVDGRFYHLDTCFCPLSGGELLYFPAAFDRYAQSAIEERIPAARRLAVPEAEALKFACNAVGVGKHVVLPTGCPETMRWLDTHGYEPHAVPLDEFMKSGGSAKCLTLALD
jgi:N-dimethylarginine dimethylaminohydrolase